MGFLDELKKLTRPYDEDEEDYMDDAELVDEADPEPVRPNPFSGFVGSNSSSNTGSTAATSAARPVRPREGKVVNLGAAGGQSQLVLVKPERFENASEIADHLREKRTVVLNLESTNKDVARRLVDFLSGVAYAGEGKIKKVAANTYIITPYSVDIMGDLIDELENNGLYL